MFERAACRALVVSFVSNRNYDEDFEDDDEGAGGSTPAEPTGNKRLGLGGGGGNNVSPPQRLGSSAKMNDLEERWKDWNLASGTT